MKRSLAITLVFIGLNVLIFWITSLPGPQEDANGLSEDPPEARTLGTLLIPEKQESSKSLLLGEVVVPKPRTNEDSFREAASSALASMARVELLTQSGGQWKSLPSTTAVCIDPQGLFAASWSRISQGEVFSLHVPGQDPVSAVVESMDPATDLVLLRSRQEVSSKPATFGRGLDTEFGEPVLLVWMAEKGDPRTAMGRLNGIDYEACEAFPHVIAGYLEIDVRLDEGQTGAGLFDRRGRFLGMVTRTSGGERDFRPLLASEEVRFVARQLRDMGYVARARTGLGVQNLTPALRHVLEISQEERGVLVTRVRPGSPAEAAGIMPGDVLTSLEEKQVTRADSFLSMLLRWPEGRQIPLQGIRGGEPIEFFPVAQALPQMADVSLPDISDDASEAARTWPEILSLEEEQRAYENGIKEVVVVQSIDHYHAHFTIPLLSGDVLLGIDRQVFDSFEEAQQVLRRLAERPRLVFQIEREGRTQWSVGRRLDSTSAPIPLTSAESQGAEEEGSD